MRISMIFLIGLLTLSMSLQAQYYTPSHASTHFQARSYGFVTELPPAPPGTKGEACLYNQAYKADIFLKDSTVLIDLPVRLDMKENRLEIEYNRDVKILPFSKVLKVLLKKDDLPEEYISTSVLRIPESSISGLVRIHNPGKVMLVSAVRAEVVKANYNVALDVGRKDNEIILKRSYFIFFDNQWIEVGNAKRAFRDKVEKVFGPSAVEAAKDVDVKNETSLLVLTEKLNKVV